MVRRLYAGSDEIVKRYVGNALTHLVEWESRSRRHTLPFTSRTIYDTTKYDDYSVITQTGRSGWIDYTWAVEKVNGVETGNKTSEVVTASLAAIEQITTKGSKRRNLLADRMTTITYLGGSPRYYYNFYSPMTRIDANKTYKVTRIGDSYYTPDRPMLHTVYRNGQISRSWGSVGLYSDGSSATVKGSSIRGRSISPGQDPYQDIIGFTFDSYSNNISPTKIILEEV